MVSRPDPRQTAALSAALSRAVDLSALKARAEASTAPAGGSAAAARPSVGQPADGYVIEVSEATFQAEGIERSLQVPVIGDLWAGWGGPCKQLSPGLERLA